MLIDQSKYTGYLWYSDKQYPEILPTSGLFDANSVANPFVVEGQLFDLDGTTSISIKFVDGKYFVKEYKLAEYEDLTDVEEYIPNRIEGVGKLLFKRVWREEKDELCENWEVLQPAELVFVGFKTNEK